MPLLAALALLAAPRAALAEGACPTGTPVAWLVSMVGDVRINGGPPRGELPFVALCADDEIAVGAQSRAGIHLLDADTPVRLDEHTVGRVRAASTRGSGLVDLARGAIYFLSQVRRTLTIRTPYVNAGVEGTEVYLRVGEAAAALMVLEGTVTLSPGADAAAPFAAETARTGEQAEVAATGGVRRSMLPSPDGRFGALRELLVGTLSWTLYYPDVLTQEEATAFPRIAEAGRLLAAGQVAAAEEVLARAPSSVIEGGLADALRAIVAVGRRDTALALALAERATAAAPGSAVPQLALSYARQLAPDLEGALTAADAAAAPAPGAPLPQARLAELHLMRGEIRSARRRADDAMRLGGGALADLVLGYTDLAALRGARAETAFRRALAVESGNPQALMGLGLALIRQGDLAAGTRQIENAVVHDPGSSLLRSYLGRALFEGGRGPAAGNQFAIAKELDPGDPTPWLYDAIRNQLENRPVIALDDIERSIDLNQNRAEFRSPLLLRQDLAARGASLARIYEDLGFQEAGRLEASRSLALDPSSASAHRFLSDLYIGQPRLEVARASQLLVAQLLSPPSSAPAQPSAPFTDLDVVPATGPLRPSFNEYSALFDGDGLRLTGDGAIGTQDTRTIETVLSGLYGRSSLSAGQFYYHGDGFRENNGVRHQIYSIIGQSQLTEALSVQAEYRYRDTHQGDLSQDFDQDGFSPDLDRDVDQHVGRFGARYSPDPGTTFLASVFVGEREEEARDLFPIGPFPPIELDAKVRSRGWSAEGQYLHQRTAWNGIFGVGTYPVENRVKDLVLYPPQLGLPDQRATETENVDQYSAYAYLNATPTPALVATAGASLDAVDGDLADETRLNPKLGLRYEALPGMTLRGAYFRTLKRELLFQQTIQPTHVAGFNQLYDDFTGTRASVLALGTDARLPFGLRGGIEGLWRSLDIPNDAGDGRVTTQADEWRAETYLFATVGERWAIGARVGFDHFKLDDEPLGRNEPERVQTWLFPLTARWFHPSGLFAEASATFLHQQVSRGDEATFADGTDSTWLLGGAVGWRLPERRGMVALQVANLLDSKFDYQDDSYRTNEEIGSRFIPERTILLRLNLNF
mgnify:CR=1 FL=1